MAKRLQVVVPDSDCFEIRRMARSRQVSVAAWVREALAHARRREPVGDVEKKFEAVGAAARHEFPTADIDTMLLEIERGRSAGNQP
jgi:hypothetical protein